VAEFTNADLQALNVHTLSSLTLNTPQLNMHHNAILALNNVSVFITNFFMDANGRVDINSGSILTTAAFYLNDDAGEIRVNSGGELRFTGNINPTLGSTVINSGGLLTAASGVTLHYSDSAILQFNTSHSVSDNVHLQISAGADISATSFLDVGNARIGTLIVTGSGSSLTAFGTSDWGLSSTGNATVTIADSAIATLQILQAGTSDARFVGSVTSSATLHTTSAFTMGGGNASRTVSLDVNNGTFQTDGLATFNNKADLNLINGAILFNAGATFNAGSRMDWTAGTLSLGANSTLLLDGGAIFRTSTTGFAFSNNTTLRIRNSGGLSTPSYFDLQNATLDMDTGTLTVGTANGTISDWGALTTTTATLASNALATYSSGLRMSTLGGTTNLTISSAAKLLASSFEVGGNANANVTITLNAGTLESPGTIELLRGTAATVNANGKIQAQNLALGSGDGTATLTVTGAGALVNVNNSLTLNANSALNIISSGAVTTSGTTTLNAGSSLTINSGGSLNAQSFTASGATLHLDLTSPFTAVPITVAATNGLTFNALTFELSFNGEPLGYYNIIRYTGAIQGAGLTGGTPAVQNNIAYILYITNDGLSNLITLHRGFLGDANDNGTVEFSDFVSLANNFGTNNTGWNGGDFNNDGITNFTDFVTLANNFGQSISGSSFTATPDQLAAMQAFAASPTQIPEPTTLSLLALALPLLARRVPRKINNTQLAR
jgi:hypothetical protein